MGLHNVELKFEGELSWLSRTRAITRTTSMIMSRRTVANGEGKKYYITIPGLLSYSVLVIIQICPFDGPRGPLGSLA